MPTFEEEVEALQHVYPGTTLQDVPGRRLVRLPSLSLKSAEWTPNPLRALLVCDSWPSQRPQLLIGDELRRRGAEPVNFARQYQAGESWFGYSFQAPWDPARPRLVPAVRGWLTRFDGRA
jgi:hypothetical protein